MHFPVHYVTQCTSEIFYIRRTNSEVFYDVASMSLGKVLAITLVVFIGSDVLIWLLGMPEVVLCPIHYYKHRKVLFDPIFQMVDNGRTTRISCSSLEVTTTNVSKSASLIALNDMPIDLEGQSVKDVMNDMCEQSWQWLYCLNSEESLLAPLNVRVCKVVTGYIAFTGRPVVLVMSLNFVIPMVATSVVGAVLVYRWRTRRNDFSVRHPSKPMNYLFTAVLNLGRFGWKTLNVGQNLV